jgi:hypothetical protein
MPSRRLVLAVIASLGLLFSWTGGPTLHAAGQAGALPTPERFLGFRVGTDNKLARWDKIVEYMRLVAASSPRVSVRELGKTTKNNSFVLVEVSALVEADARRPHDNPRGQAAGGWDSWWWTAGSGSWPDTSNLKPQTCNLEDPYVSQSPGTARATHPAYHRW